MTAPMPAPRAFPTAESLMSRATEATGLTDFGPGDFRDGLGVLLASLEHDAELAPAAETAVIDDLVRRLSNRLEVEAWLRAHPAIAKLPLRGPVDVIGLPRTGTTALGNMLSLDPQFRCLRGWEQAKPCPPPTLAGEPRDPRRQAAIEQDRAVSPELKAMHLYEVDAAFEDTEILGMAFHGQQYTLPVYTYHAWWRESDCRPTFAYHRRVVQLLQSQRPPNLWLFKSPHHKFHLEAFVSAYPDARFLMTHRDPARVVPSYSSIVSTIFPASRSSRDPKRVGREVSEHLRIGMANAIAARERLGEQRFFDVHQRELDTDPMGTLERVYAFLDLELRPEVRATLVTWQHANRSGAHGAHRYSPEQFGLSAAQIRSDYDFYIRRFDVPIEG
jgi:hypothetical protein